MKADGKRGGRLVAVCSRQIPRRGYGDLASAIRCYASFGLDEGFQDEGEKSDVSMLQNQGSYQAWSMATKAKVISYHADRLGIAFV